MLYLYHTMIYPCLYYCMHVWGPILKTTLNTQFITLTKYSPDTRSAFACTHVPLFHLLNVLVVQELHKYDVGLLMHKYHHHDDVIKWKHFPRYWPFVRGIYRFPVNSPHKGQWRGALMFSLICARINGWVKNREASDLRRHRTHYDVIAMIVCCLL